MLRHLLGSPGAILLAALLLAGCQAGTEPTDPAGAYSVEFVNEICSGKQAAEAEIVSSIEKARACDTDADCKIVSFGCPFGCAHSINQANEGALRAKVAAFNQGDCPSCAYRCAGHQQLPRCIAGVCSARDPDSETLLPPSA